MRALPVLLFFLSFAAALTPYAGKDAGWDTLNYHLHNGWAFWGGRHAIDLPPAQLLFFFNPLIDLPLGWMLRQGWSDVAIALLFGLMRALNGFLVYLIARRLDVRQRTAGTLGGLWRGCSRLYWCQHARPDRHLHCELKHRE